MGLATAGNLRFQASSGLTTGLNQKCEMERGCDIWGLDASGDLKLIGSGKYDIRYTNATDFS